MTGRQVSQEVLALYMMLLRPWRMPAAIGFRSAPENKKKRNKRIDKDNGQPTIEEKQCSSDEKQRERSWENIGHKA